MNQQLKTALDFIQKSKGLSADEKSALVKVVSEAAKELEASNKQLEIETSLERVRVVVLGMKKPEDLPAICEILYNELISLGFTDIRRTMVNIDDDETASFINYDYSPDFGTSATRHIYNSHPAVNFLDHIRKTKDAFAEVVFTGNDFKDFKEYRRKRGEEEDSTLENVSALYYYFYSIGTGSIGLSAYKSITEDKRQILKRFRNVFDFAYRRYLDIAQAEAQTREAKIEAALERVRSRTMAMQHSDELPETVFVLFQQFKELGEAPDQMNIGIVNEEEWVFEISGTDPNDVGSKFSQIIKMPFDEPTLAKPLYEAWKAQKKSMTFDLHGQALVDYINFRSKLRGVPVVAEQMQGHRIINVAFFSKGTLSISTLEPRPASTIALLERFAGVFDLTYTRFLDLKQAEAQAREAQIEAALERVRSRTMAMQRPDELAETAAVLFQQFVGLGVTPLRIFFGTIMEESSELACWVTDQGGNKLSNQFKAKYRESEEFSKMYEAWKEGQRSLTIFQTGKQLSDYVAFLRNLGLPFKEGDVSDRRAQTIAFFSRGLIGITTLEPQPEETVRILERFAGVFDLTYTRFLDLQKAEAQAKEAQIERERSEALLLNILPADIANELKQFGKSYARSHDEVTILFADIKNFSAIAENMSPQDLVTQLDECFRAFDHIVEKHGLEKIKTIGDAYMCVCGLPQPVPDNAFRTVKAALAMLEFIKGFGIAKQAQDLPAFEFRVGIHTGPVVTGVVGLKKFTYDIWGDAVNMAARMEQHGEAGRINISGNTYELVKERFETTYRGKVPAKNKGEVDMYFVERLN